MFSGEQGSRIEKAFESTGESENLGGTREVRRESLEKVGENPVDLIVKDRASEQEVKILRLLSGLGVAEELVTFDAKKIVVERLPGKDLWRYKEKLFARSPYARVNNYSGKKYFDEEGILHDAEARNLCADFISKSIFLLLNGISHFDIQAENIRVQEGGDVKFIDFGAAALIDSSMDEMSLRVAFWSNLASTFDEIQNLHPAFKKIMIAAGGETTELNDTELPSIVKGAYDNALSAPLAERPKILAAHLNYEDIENYLTSLEIPDLVASHVSRKLVNLIMKSAARE